jgi:hypothetical protein
VGAAGVAAVNEQYSCHGDKKTAATDAWRHQRSRIGNNPARMMLTIALACAGCNQNDVVAADKSLVLAEYQFNGSIS